MRKTKRKIDCIIIHHSYSMWGSAKVIDKWHKQRGWKGIGYHYVICNGYLSYRAWAQNRYNVKHDGLIQTGRPVERVGAHCKGKNRTSIGICIIGNFDAATPRISARQYAALIHCLATLCERHDVSPKRIFYHRQFAFKTCPGNHFPPRALVIDDVLEKLGDP